jgi:hypothetical protein
MEAKQHEKGPAGDLSRDMDAAEPGAEDVKAENAEAGNAEELEQEATDHDDDSGTELGTVTDAFERESEPLRQGNTLATPAGPLPVRSLIGMGLMVAVAVAIYFVAWGLFGTLGLLLGWIPAAAAGFFVAREYGRRAAS